MRLGIVNNFVILVLLIELNILQMGKYSYVNNYVKAIKWKNILTMLL
jgi:hypothetical protein